MGWLLRLGLFVGALVALGSVAGRRWNARGGLFDPLPTLDPSHDGTGRTAIVTGGNAGLGLEMVRGLYRMGYHVIIASRSRARGQAAQAQLEAEETGGQRGTLATMELDLGSLQSVSKFVSSLATDKVDVLVGNAGVYASQVATQNGISETAQVNHYAHALLANLLLPKVASFMSCVFLCPHSSGAAACCQWPHRDAGQPHCQQGNHSVPRRSAGNGNGDGSMLLFSRGIV